jgi:hypothetical protein
VDEETPGGHGLIKHLFLTELTRLTGLEKAGEFRQEEHEGNEKIDDEFLQEGLS